ncbi:MAG: peptide deformylase, partial [Rhodospirillales bacterium]|nr:peptide deformylase [Rhodospirillales bacterium]
MAGPQVVVQQGMVVMDLHGEDEPRNPQILVNPEVLDASEETATMSEGCLSVPETYEEVERPARVTVRYQDLDGVAHTRECTGLE